MPTARKRPTLVTALSRSTGVSEAEVHKVLHGLGLGKVIREALKLNRGQEIRAASLRLHLKVGKTLIVA